MPGRWKEWKSKSSFPTSFHRPLEISQKARDFHISTARNDGFTSDLQTKRQEDDQLRG